MADLNLLQRIAPAVTGTLRDVFVRPARDADGRVECCPRALALEADNRELADRLHAAEERARHSEDVLVLLDRHVMPDLLGPNEHLTTQADRDAIEDTILGIGETDVKAVMAGDELPAVEDDEASGDEDDE